ncbi:MULTISPECIES: four-carbon acid sugar kinase family protein [unclassified Raoultella]|uniref:four-carbon acid sugar kinase family protein n=1 Tax=unclassified Raoultella TaxID=2627600 RepID=UPI001358C5C8|nr:MULTISPECIES: four-carbon acid sugar kinase family protein [unclassified Raoultella]
MKILILADDLTGSADCVAGFVRSGRSVRLGLGSDILIQSADILALDLDTRRRTKVEAGDVCVQAYRKLIQPGTILFKKIDSLLRGNWSDEVAALCNEAGLAIIAPAYPLMGRTVVNGRVYVHGHDLSTTDDWKIAKSGEETEIGLILRASHIESISLTDADVALYAEHLTDKIQEWAESGVKALIIDSRISQTLHTVAVAASNVISPVFLVGSAGLANELAEIANPVPDSSYAPFFASNGSTVVVVGSLSAMTSSQTQNLQQLTSQEEIVVPASVLRTGVRHPEWPLFQRRIMQLIKFRDDFILRIGKEEHVDYSEGRLLSERLALLIAPYIKVLKGIILTGGETARAVMDAAHINELSVKCEITRGVMASRPCETSKLLFPWVITKAGSFGDSTSLHMAWNWLKHLPEYSNYRINN